MPDNWKISEHEKIEYDQAFQMWRHLGTIRRHDLAFMTIAQGSIVTIIHENLYPMDDLARALSVLGLIIALIGCNNDRRVHTLLIGLRERAREIEDASEGKMRLAAMGNEKVDDLKWRPSSKTVFIGYFAILAVFWFILIGRNLLRLVCTG